MRDEMTVPKGREIKFRAWDVEGPKMVYFGLADGDMGLVPDEGHWLAAVDIQCCPVMQYTGLKDKNGKAIYEGDLCRIGEGQFWTAEVSFVGAGFCFVNRNCCPVCAEGRGCIGSIDEFAEPIEVIGNIYENPELLEKKS